MTTCLVNVFLLLSISLVYQKNDTLPTYKTEWNDSNSTGKIIATKDSIFRNILIRNKFYIKQEWQGKFWQRKTLFTSVKNLNPNTTTTELQTFVKQPKKHHPLVIFGSVVLVGVVSFIFVRHL